MIDSTSTTEPIVNPDENIEGDSSSPISEIYGVEVVKSDDTFVSGMSIVEKYKVQNQGGSQFIIVKRLSPNADISEKLSFMREEDIMLYLKSRNISGIPNIAYTDTSGLMLRKMIPYVGQADSDGLNVDGLEDSIVMDFIEGQAMSDISMTVFETLEAFRSPIKTLVEAERAGILNLDFKSQNIIVNEDGKGHLIDWGVSYPLEVAIDQHNSFSAYKALLTATSGLAPLPNLSSKKNDPNMMRTYMYNLVCVEITRKMLDLDSSIYDEERFNDSSTQESYSDDNGYPIATLKDLYKGDTITDEQLNAMQDIVNRAANKNAYQHYSSAGEILQEFYDIFHIDSY